MKKIISTIIIIMAFATTVHADEKHDLVLKMLEITNAKKNHELMIKAYRDQISQSPQFNVPGMDKYFTEAMAWETLIGPHIEIYKEVYTVEELKAINTFFSSPEGKSFIEKSPEVNQKSSAVVVANMQKAIKHIINQKNKTTDTQRKTIGL